MIGNYDERTFVSAAEAFVLTIRDHRPDVPILIVSPIYCSYLEEAPNRTGMTLRRMRELDIEIVERLKDYGDSNIAYFDGLQLFGEADAHLLDAEAKIHPVAEAQYLMAERFRAYAFGRGGLFNSNNF